MWLLVLSGEFELHQNLLQTFRADYFIDLCIGLIDTLAFVSFSLFYFSVLLIYILS